MTHALLPEPMTFPDLGEQIILARVPPGDAQGRPASAAYPSGWLDQDGHLYRCWFQADEHDRLAAAWGPRIVPAAAGDWRRALELEGWRALYSDGTLKPENATLTQILALMVLAVDSADELEPAYNDGLVRTIYRLLAHPLAPDAPLPDRLPLPPLPDAGEVAQVRGSLVAWLAPDGTLYTSLYGLHGRFAVILAHVLGVAGPASLNPRRRLERAGWAHLHWDGYVQHIHPLTDAQLGALRVLMVDDRLPVAYRRKLASWFVSNVDLERREVGQ